MIGPLKRLFDQQLRLAEGDAEFVSRLDASRTVLLEDLIADVKRPERLALLGAPWLDAQRFTARIAAACAWLDGTALADGVKGWAGLPMIFFQRREAAEDEAEHLRRRVDAFYEDRVGLLPTEAFYLHVRTNVHDSLDGDWAAGGLRIRKLCSTYSSYRKPFVYDAAFKPNPVSGYFIGYRLPDYPSLLDVSREIATDFFARIVVHDLCHAFLPSTPFKAEGFHNVSALAAMGTLPPIRYRHAWEEFLHAECTDPAFCLRAADEIAAMRRALGIPSPIQKDLIEGYRKWYAHPDARWKRRVFWGLPDDADARELHARIEEARADGFRINLRLMDDT